MMETQVKVVNIIKNTTPCLNTVERLEEALELAKQGKVRKLYNCVK